MEKITFVNGKVPALNATNLNQLQTNTENSINQLQTDVESSISQLQTNLENAINAVHGVPAGGTTGQVLSKKTGTNYDTEWVDQTGGTGGGDTFPIGAIVPYVSDTMPTNWLLCDGDAISRTEYAELFSIIGTTFGAGDGSTTFNLPNLKGRVTVGRQPSDSDFSSIGKTGGSKYIQEHYHEYKYGSAVGGDGSALTYASTTGTQVNKQAIQNVKGVQTGNSGNLQPYMATNYIIKVKMSASLEGQVIDSLNSSSTTDAPSINAVKEALKTNITTGTEVATNEYIDGKQVYIKRISFTMSSTTNAWQTVDTISNLDKIINVFGTMKTSGGEIIPLPTTQASDEIVKIYIASQNGNVQVYHTYDYANSTPCYLNIYYTKN